MLEEVREFEFDSLDEGYVYKDKEGNILSYVFYGSDYIDSEIGKCVSSPTRIAEDAWRIADFISKHSKRKNDKYNIEDEIVIGYNQDGHLALVDYTEEKVYCDDIVFDVVKENSLITLNEEKPFDFLGQKVMIGSCPRDIVFYDEDKRQFITVAKGFKLAKKENGLFSIVTSQMEKALSSIDDIVKAFDEREEETPLEKNDNNFHYTNGVEVNKLNNINKEEVQRLRNNFIATTYINPNFSIEFNYESLLKLNKNLYKIFDGAGELREFNLGVDSSLNISSYEDIEEKAKDLFRVYTSDNKGNLSYRTISEVLQDKTFLEDKKKVLNLLSSFMYNGHKLAPFNSGNSATINIMVSQIAKCCGFELDLKKLEGLASKTNGNKLNELSALYTNLGENEWGMNFVENIETGEKYSTHLFDNIEEKNAQFEEERKQLKESISEKYNQILKLNQSKLLLTNKNEIKKIDDSIRQLNKERNIEIQKRKKLFAAEKNWKKTIETLRSSATLAAKEESQYFNKINKILDTALTPISMKETNFYRKNSNLESMSSLNTYEFGNEIIRLSQIQKGIPFEKVDTRLLASKIVRTENSAQGYKWERSIDESTGLEKRECSIYNIDSDIKASNFPLSLLDKDLVELPSITDDSTRIQEQMDDLQVKIDNNTKLLEMEMSNPVDVTDENELPEEARKYEKERLEEEIEQDQSGMNFLQKLSEKISSDNTKESITNEVKYREFIRYNKDGSYSKKGLLNERMLRVIDDFSPINPYYFKVENLFEPTDEKEGFEVNSLEDAERIEENRGISKLTLQRIHWSDKSDISYNLEFCYESGRQILVKKENIIFNERQDHPWQQFQDLDYVIKYGYLKNPEKIKNTKVFEAKNGASYSYWDAEKDEKIILEGKRGIEKKEREQDFRAFKNKNLKFISKEIYGLVGKAFIEYVPKELYNQYSPLEPKLESLCIIRDVELTKDGKVNAIVERNKEYYVVNDLLRETPDFTKCIKTKEKTLEATRNQKEKGFKWSKVTEKKENLIDIDVARMSGITPMNHYKEVFKKEQYELIKQPSQIIELEK